MIFGYLGYWILRILLADFASGIATPGGRINVVLANYAAWSFAWLGAIWIVLVRRRGIGLPALGYVTPPQRWAMLGILLGFIALLAAFLIFMLLRPVLGDRPEVDLRQVFGDEFTVVHAVALLLYAGVLVPIAEELVFRALIFRWLRERMDFRPAALVTAGIFGLMHQRIEQMVIAGLLGVVLAWLYERSRSLVPAILMHQTYNSLNLMLTFAVIWFGGPNSAAS
ncbi:MAG: CPBP family intramembrane metalloprotease [Rhodospirillaceae bacterium]|nr:CPBP family intramembrane metalloprotease [Rhodospirillaceae bacterium]